MGSVHVWITEKDGRISEVKVGGHGVLTGQGTIMVPPMPS